MGKKSCAVLVALLPALIACNMAPGPDMRPGEDCLSCHVAGGSGPVFSAAGTVFDSLGSGVDGVTVTISDSAQHTQSATTSAAGNFYFTESLTPPLQVYVEKGGTRVSMPALAESGACNSCHGSGSAGQIRLQ